jgi:uncharacterized protein
MPLIQPCNWLYLPRPMSHAETAAAASRLCKACGLCCNGVLFHIVRLQPADSPKELEALGMKVSRKKREPYFKQPCGFLKEDTCCHYTARPLRCRLFACRQLRQLADGQVTEDDVMHTIADAKRKVAGIEALLTDAGNTAPDLPLTERYEQVMAAADCAGAKATSRDLLVKAMIDLRRVLGTSFRVEPEEPAGAK